MTVPDELLVEIADRLRESGFNVTSVEVRRIAVRLERGEKPHDYLEHAIAAYLQDAGLVA